MALLKLAVENALVAAALAGDFYKKTVDPVTKLSAAAETVPNKVVPASVTANEIEGTFGDSQNKRTELLDRTGWTWELHLAFPCEVALERFEEAVTQPPLKVLKNTGAGINRQVTLRLVSASFRHPAQQQSPSGTRAVYTFTARLGPL